MFRDLNTLLLLLIFSPSITIAQTTLPLADWTVVESQDQFLDCSKMDEAKYLDPWGMVEDTNTNLEAIHYFFDPANLPDAKLRYFCMDYATAKRPDPKHEIVKSSKALSIRSLVHVRDYEQNEIDGGRPLLPFEYNYDTVHVIAVTDIMLDQYDQNHPQLGITKITKQESINNMLDELKNRKQGFYEKEKYKSWRMSTLDVFREISNEQNHKMVKGPYNSGKSAPKTEEEWGSLENGGVQFMCYKNGGCAIFNLEGLSPKSIYVYVLFYAGDGGGAKDDFMGIVKIPTAGLKNIGSKYAYYQYDPSREMPCLDFAVQFEVVDTSTK